MTRLSIPIFLSSRAKKLDDRESAINPVSGDFVTTAYLAVVVRPVPTSGALAKISGFAGANGSTRGGANSYSKLVPRPTPPKNPRKREPSRSRRAQVPALR